MPVTMWNAVDDVTIYHRQHPFPNEAEAKKFAITVDSAILTANPHPHIRFMKIGIGLFATFLMLSGCARFGCISGNCINGEGAYRHIRNSTKYVGQFKDSFPHGQGTMTRANGDKYVGQFDHDSSLTQGTYTFHNGDNYAGYFNSPTYLYAFSIHGQGTFTDVNGNKYVGQFKRGDFHGQGTFTDANGNRYVGQFEFGKFQGQGTFTYANGDQYVGSFNNGNFEGKGTLKTKVPTIQH